MDLKTVIKSKRAHIKQYTDWDKIPPEYDVGFLDGLEFAASNIPDVIAPKNPEIQYVEKTITLTEYKDRIIKEPVYITKTVEVVKEKIIYLDRLTKEPLNDKAIREFYDLPDPIILTGGSQ